MSLSVRFPLCMINEFTMIFSSLTLFAPAHPVKYFSVTVGCSGSLESNLDLLSSVMETSDDETTEISSNGGHLVRSQSELGKRGWLGIA